MSSPSAISIKTALDIKFTKDTTTFYWKEKEELTLQIKNILHSHPTKLSYINVYSEVLSNPDCIVEYILKYLEIKTYKSDIEKIGMYSAKEKRNIFLKEILKDCDKEFFELLVEPLIKEDIEKDGSYYIEISKSELCELLSCEKLRSLQLNKIMEN